MNYSDFVEACKANEVFTVSQILDTHPNFIDLMNEQQGSSVLIEAAKQDHLELLKLLIDKGGDVNAVDNAKWSALIWASASRKGLVQVAKLLLASGADVDAETTVDDTALIKACRFGQDAIVQLLVDHGANVNKQDRAGTCALMNACAKCSAATVQLLIDAGATVDCISSYGISPFSAACDRGDEEIINIVQQARGAYLLNKASPPTVTTLISDNNTTKSPKAPSITSIRRADLSLDVTPISYTACSTVYRGTYHHTRVAVKMLRHNISSQTIQTEIKVLSELRHPRVLMLLGVVHDVLPHEGCVALVTEYMYGGSLDAVLHSTERNMKLSKKIRVLLDVADGMRFLHSFGVIHRDLKTSNILLDHEYRAKVGDFGHSTILDPTMSQVTGDVTTIAYASPESLGDRREVGLASDTYSFGVVMWEVVSGMVPWKGLTFAQIAARISRGETLPHLEASESCPALLIDLIEACFDIPDNRPLFSYIYVTLLSILRDQINIEKSTHFPIEFMCPIGHDIMKDPVQCFDGHSYERCNIEKWLSRCQTSPMTGERLDNVTVVPNYSLKSTIEAYLDGKLVERTEFGSAIEEL